MSLMVRKFTAVLDSKLGLRTEFRSEKIQRNRLGTVSVILRKKVLIPRHSEVYGRVKWIGMELREINLFYKTAKIT